MKMVEEGEVDAAVASELSARYMIDHYYPQGLHYTRIDGLPVAAIRLAIPRDEPVLAAILNKALQVIPPRDILQMTEKWSKISSQQIENWSQYSRQFYQLIAFALVLIAISLGWGLSCVGKCANVKTPSSGSRRSWRRRRPSPVRWSAKRQSDSGDKSQEPLSGQHEPQAAHAGERHRRLSGAAGET